MKKRMLTTVFCLIILTGCGSVQTATNRSGSGTATVDDVLKEQIAKEDGEKIVIGPPPVSSRDVTPTSAPTPIPVDEEQETVLSTTEGIDLDLTILSSTMVYSEVYNIMYTPEEYIGKTIKMDGLYTFFHDDTNGMDYYACIIKDATACCAQGIEFEPVNPEACPEEGGEVTVVGVFDVYQEGEYMYCTLRDAEVL